MADEDSTAVAEEYSSPAAEDDPMLRAPAEEDMVREPAAEDESMLWESSSAPPTEMVPWEVYASDSG